MRKSWGFCSSETDLGLTLSSARFTQLFRRRPNHIKPGLERIRVAFQHLGQPSLSTPHILVAGTNGKGTTSGYLYQMLSNVRSRVGLYTSPHLVNFCERIQISDRIVQDELLADTWEQVKGQLEPHIECELSFFEIATLLAFVMFEDAKTVQNIFEVGLGGRWDATNILNPDVSIITNIGLDHQQFLGPNRCQIALEKSGVMRPNRPVIIGDLSDGAVSEGVLNSLLDQANQIQAHVFQFGCHFGIEENHYFYRESKSEAKQRLQMPDEILGEPKFLQHNFTLAATALLASSSLTISDMATLWSRWAERRKPMTPSFWGRFQDVHVRLIDGDVNLLLDVCHNEDGAKQFVEEITNHALLKSRGQSLPPAFISVLGDKNINEILDIFRSNLSPIVLFKSNDERTFHEQQLADRHRDLRVFDSFDRAWAYACKEWPREGLWVACGSVRAVGELFEFFRVTSRDNPHEANVESTDS